MLTLFVLSTMDDWFLFLQNLSNVKGNSELTAITFVVSFLVLMSFIIMNVFIGFVIVLFHKEREKDDHYHVLNNSAQECLLTALSANPSRLYEVPKGLFRTVLFKIATHPKFQSFSMVLILVNTGFMMTKHTRQDETVTMVQRWGNLVFTGIFTLEVAIKLIAFSIKALARDYWLLFDTIVIMGSWIDIVLDELNISFLKLSIFRLFRVARLAQVLGKGGNLRQLFSTFLKSMRCVPSIACLMGLLLYFYAILGMNVSYTLYSIVTGSNKTF
jgi:Ion transport protein.